MWKYSTQIDSHQEELGIKETFTDQKYLSILSLQNENLNLDSSSGSGRNNGRENIVNTKFTFSGGANHSAEKN